MHDRPSAEELIAAVRQHLEAAILPAIEDRRLRFQTLVAAHVLGIVERELGLSAGQIEAEWLRLGELLADAQPLPTSQQATAIDERNRRICELIQQGAFDAEPEQSKLWQHLAQTAAEKLTVANPKFLARLQREGGL